MIQPMIQASTATVHLGDFYYQVMETAIDEMGNGARVLHALGANYRGSALRTVPQIR